VDDFLLLLDDLGEVNDDRALISAGPKFLQLLLDTEPARHPIIYLLSTGLQLLYICRE
jgi:hypothetical protein